MKTLAAVALAGALSMSSAFAADLVRIESAHDVPTTIDRLAAAVEKAGATVFARIDHAKGAAGVDMPIPDNQVLIFGNPALGTPAIRDAATAGLDLPLRVQAFDEGGRTVLVYHPPASLAAAHGLAADHPSIAKMAGALGKLTAAAAE